MNYYYYDVVTHAGCIKCGRFTRFETDMSLNIIGDPKFPQTCSNCIENNFSKKVIRNKKLEEILKPWWQFWK